MSKFQPSINVMYDTGKTELFDQFVPNINQLDILEEILKGILDDQIKSHLLIGPYGAGKSMVGALVASLITARKNSKDVSNFLQNVRTVSPSSYETISTLVSLKDFRWLPVLITGKNGDFEQIILDAILNHLKEQDISISLKGDGEQILKTVLLWKREYKSTYKQLEEYCQRLTISLDKMLENIKAGDEEFVIEFKKMYPHLTSGAVFLSETKASFVDQIEYILMQLHSKKIGIFLVYDEFGRFLQTVNQSSIYQTMQGLQDLTEIANRSNNAGLLFITHTGLRQYAAANNSLSKSELERVEKRFKEHRLESDPALFYRSAFKILKIVRSSESGNLFLVEDIEYLRGELLKYNLFPEMSPAEIDGAVLEGCQPIHPLTIRLLPVLSNILGQNDRTLYTFLSQMEHVSNESNWYYADQLFDYFYPDESTFYLIEDLKFYRLAMSYDLSVEAKRIVKMITLLNITNSPFSISNSFLEFALALPSEKINAALFELTHVKLVRFNRFADSYELYSGSIVEFESLFTEYKQSIIISDAKRINYIDKMFMYKYYLPLSYNSDKSMTRFIEARFSWKEQLDFIETDGDGTLVYLMYRNLEEYHFLIEQVKEQKQKNVLFCIPSFDVDLLQAKLDDFIVLDMILADKEILQQDENLKSEIEIRLENVKYDIEQLLSSLYQFDTNSLKWFFNGEEKQSFTSKESLESFLSKWMYERYPYTLEVRNEAFNKRNVTVMQKKAAILILEQLIDPGFDGNFFIEGFGPDYLIYATLLKNQQYDVNELDKLNNPDLGKIREALKKHVKEHSRGKILDLYKILSREPFGIRDPLIPILTVALLKDYWNQMAFYANDFYINEMNADLLYKILEQKVEFYEYEIYQLSLDTTETLEAINEVFFESRLPTQPVVLFTALTNWLRKLPRYTQITNSQPEHILRFKEAIRHSETDPLEAAYRLEGLLGQKDINRYLTETKTSLENHLLSSRDLVIKTILNVFGVTSTKEWKTWADENLKLVQSNPILIGVSTRMHNSEDWLTYLVEKTVGVDLRDWSDVTYDSFIASTKQLLQSDNNASEVRIVTGDQTIMKIKEVGMSVKGRTVYNNVSRIIQSGGRTMSSDEVKFIVYKILSELDN